MKTRSTGDVSGGCLLCKAASSPLHWRLQQLTGSWSRKPFNALLRDVTGARPPAEAVVCPACARLVDELDEHQEHVRKLRDQIGRSFHRNRQRRRSAGGEAASALARRRSSDLDGDRAAGGDGGPADDALPSPDDGLGDGGGSPGGRQDQQDAADKDAQTPDVTWLHKVKMEEGDVTIEQTDMASVSSEPNTDSDTEWLREREAEKATPKARLTAQNIAAARGRVVARRRADRYNEKMRQWKQELEEKKLRKKKKPLLVIRELESPATLAQTNVLRASSPHISCNVKMQGPNAMDYSLEPAHRLGGELIHTPDNHVYTRNRGSNGSIYLRCVHNRTKGIFCPGTGRLHDNKMVPLQSHTHEPNTEAMQVRRLTNDVRKAVLNDRSSRKLKEIYDEVVGGSPVAHLVTWQCMRQKMQRDRYRAMAPLTDETMEGVTIGDTADTSAQHDDMLSVAAQELVSTMETPSSSWRTVNVRISGIGRPIERLPINSDPLTINSDPLTGSSDPLADGSCPLTDGSGPLADGSGPLADGSGPLADGSGPLADGSGPLADCSGPLADGSAAPNQIPDGRVQCQFVAQDHTQNTT